MAGGSDVNRGPHTGSGTEAAIDDLNKSQLASVIPDMDLSNLLSPATGVQQWAVFSKDTSAPVQMSQASFTNSFDPEEVRTLIDLFAGLSNPIPSGGIDSLEIGGKKYNVSGPRGGQYPLEMATLHGEERVLFVTSSATMLCVFEAAPGADTQHKTDAKQGLWTAVRGFTHALSEKGL